ncbi:MAG TPA: CBS domain-containing protein [Blastocatellia bacterium]|nr:CBS domain-containing protein [Blastocatellia bacterium]
MKVRDVMNENVKSCQPNTNLAEATGMMWDYDCGVLPVVGDGGETVGVVTDRDIAIALGTRNLPAWAIPVGEVMSQSLFSVSPNDDIHTALKLMRKDKVRRLPVLNTKGALEGILCLNDIALHAEHSTSKKASELTYEDVVNTLKAVCEHRHPTVAKELHNTATT